MSPRWTRRLAVAGLAGVTAFVAASLALHAALAPDSPRFMSGFARTRFVGFWTIALWAFAVGGLLLTLALRQALGRRRSPMGIWILALAGGGAGLLAVFPVDATAENPSLPGTIHEDAAPLTLFASAAAMLALLPAFAARPAWRSFRWPSLVLAVVVVGGAYVCVTGGAAQSESGVAQRTAVAAIVVWLGLLGFRLLRLPEPDARADAVGKSPPPVVRKFESGR